MSRRNLKKLHYIFIILISIATICAVIAAVFLHNYLKKENNLVMFKTENKSQEIYILGTIHNHHFNKLFDYSIVNIQSTIDAIDPDLILVEVRQDSVDNYDALDGPIEMVFAWSYAKEAGIEVKGIDWFELSENRRANKTDDLRDDHIFDNIMATIQDESKVMIICGVAHRVEQSKRFIENRYTQVVLKDKASYFNNLSTDSFVYPTSMTAELKKQIVFWETIAIDEAKKGTTEESNGRQYWLKQLKNVAKSSNVFLDEYITPNKLYR